MAVSLYSHSEAVTNHPPLYEWTGRGQGGRQMRGPLLTPAGRGGKFSGDWPPPAASREGEGIWAVVLGNSEAPRGFMEN